jgi:hypothetical protein
MAFQETPRQLHLKLTMRRLRRVLSQADLFEALA